MVSGFFEVFTFQTSPEKVNLYCLYLQGKKQKQEIQRQKLFFLPYIMVHLKARRAKKELIKQECKDEVRGGDDGYLCCL